MLYRSSSYGDCRAISETRRRICGINGRVKEGIKTLITRLLPPARLEATMLGTNACSPMMCKIRSRVAGSTSGLAFRARETVALETPAKRAISLIVSFLDISLLFDLAARCLQ